MKKVYQKKPTTGITRNFSVFILFIIIFLSCLALFSEHNQLQIQSLLKQQQRTLDRNELLINLVRGIGFNGVIHHFKNFVIRGQLDYQKKAENEFLIIDGILRQYRLLDLTEGEKDALLQVEFVLKQYQQNIVITQRHYLTHKNPIISEIDYLVRVDDKPLVDGLLFLNKIAKEYNGYKAFPLLKNKSINPDFLILLIELLILFFIFTIAVSLFYMIRKYKQGVGGNSQFIKLLQEDKWNNQQLLLSRTEELDEELKKNEGLYSELKLSAAAFEANEAIIITDTSLKILKVNKTFCRITGYNNKEILGKTPRILQSGTHDKLFYKQVWQQISETGVWAGEVVDRKKDGELFMAWLSISAITNSLGEVIYYLAHLNDMTTYSKTRAALNRRLKVETVVAEVAIKALETEFDMVDKSIDECLMLLGVDLLADRSYLFSLASDGSTMSNTHEWCEENIEPQKDLLKDMSVSPLSWSMGILLRNGIFKVDDVDDLPLEAEAEQMEFRSQGIQSILLIPIMDGNKLTGFFGFDRVKEKRSWRKEDVTLLKVVAEIFYLVQHRYRIERENKNHLQETKKLLVEKTKLFDQNRELTLGIIRAQEKERHFLAQELHDELGQIVTGIRTNTHYLQKVFDKGDMTEVKNGVAQIENLSVKAISRLRLTTRKIRTATLDQLGLLSAIKELADDWGENNIEASIELNLSDELGEITEDVMITVYRAVQESLTNISKYAQACQVNVTLERITRDSGNLLHLTVLDDGVGGVDTEKVSTGIGLLGMRERVLALDGDIYVSQGEGASGTCISIYIPI